ncbi:MAG: carboxypeptidase regulatory-like domain-containing protein [Bryobacteraceae bacterium]
MNTTKGLVLSLLFLIVSALAFGQTETGQITGKVTDPTGAAVANAAVEVKGSATGVTRTTQTNGSGEYTVSNLLPGMYTVTANATGFAKSEQRVTLQVGARLTQDFALEVGQTTSTVTVSENPVQVNTETQTLSTVVNERELRELPNLTRNPYQFVALAGNVSDAGMGTRGAGVAINGQREASTNILLDGAANNDEFGGNIGQQIPLDAVQEFSVLTANFTAEYGRASGGIVNVVTKSGSNSFHGTAYEFNRVSRFSSNTFQANANEQAKSVFVRNQFGYSVGGPIVKDKLFFFNSTEWIRVRSGATSLAWVPTPQLIAATPPNTQGFFNALGQLRSNSYNLGTISRSGLVAATGTDPCAGIACASLPSNLPLFQHVGYTVPTDAGGGVPQNTYMTLGRVDYNLSDKTQMYGHYALFSETEAEGALSSSPYANYDLGQTFFNNNALFSIIHSFSPTWTSQSKVSFNRLTNIQQGLTSRGLVPTMYASISTVPTIGTDSVLFPGYNPLTPGNGGSFGGPQNYIQAFEDVTYNRGKHSFRFGGSYDYIRDNRTYAAYQTAVDGLGNGGLGPAIGALLAGTFRDIQVSVDPKGAYPCVSTAAPTANCQVTLPVSSPNFSRSNRFHEFALYAQDSWKVMPRLTLNLGLRWEYFGVQHNKNANLDSNYYASPIDLADNNLAQYIRTGQIQPAPQSSIGSLWKPDWNNLAPRVGFAWDVTGDGKTSLRGGYGIGYERNFGNVTFNVIQNPPNYAVLDLPGPISPNNFGPFANAGGTLPLPAVSLRIVNPNIKNAYAHMWNFSLERQLTSQIVWSAEYSGSKGVDLYTIAYPNEKGYGNLILGDPCTPPNCTSAPRNAQYGQGIGYRGNQGFSNYNALSTKVVVRNLGNAGIDMTMNYTWSHAIDNVSSTFFEAAGIQTQYGNSNITTNNGNYVYGLLNPYDPRLDKGNAEFDVRHRVVVAGSWKIPTGNRPGLVGALVRGWSLNPVFTARTGQPFSVFDATNQNYNARQTPRATFTSGVPSSGQPLVPAGTTPDSYRFISFSPSQILQPLNPACNCSDIAPFPIGMSGRDAFRAPGFWTFDLGVNKDTKLTERVTLQLRAETFNLFNHANLYVVGNSAELSQQSYVSACYGCTNSTYDRRNLQLAAKFIF